MEPLRAGLSDFKDWPSNEQMRPLILPSRFELQLYSVAYNKPQYGMEDAMSWRNISYAW